VTGEHSQKFKQFDWAGQKLGTNVSVCRLVALGDIFAATPHFCTFGTKQTSIAEVSGCRREMRKTPWP